MFVFSSVTNSGWTVLNEWRNIQKPTALKWQFCPLCCLPKNFWCLAANRSCGKNSTSKNPLKVYRLPLAPMLVLAQAQTCVPLWLRRIKWDKPPMLPVTQPRREHASIYRNCNIQTVTKDMHYPRCQELDQELQVVTWRPNYIDFQVIFPNFASRV